MSKIQLTQEQFDQLEERIKEIENIEIPKNSDEIERAKEFGDLSENAEYHSAKEYHSKLFDELNELKEKASKAEIIQKSDDLNTVQIGHYITLKCKNTGEILNFQLIGESGNGINLIDAKSKLGESILNKKLNETISFQANNPEFGMLSYEITSIK